MTRMPVLFVGHGSPMNAVEDNAWSRGFRALGSLVGQPKAILAVSAHWYERGTALTGEQRPATIHDFGGFPEELYSIQYPAPGAPELALRISRLLGEKRAPLRTDWGLDHGTWSVLRHLRPQADLPVLQLAIDADLAPAGHLALGAELQPLRDEGVLIFASGNITHNLRHAFTSARRGDNSTPDWAARFDTLVTKALEQHDGPALARALESADGRNAHPTPDHYLPLLYAAGAAGASDAVQFPIAGFDLGSLSMRSVLLG
jgi:4,5-DOPA dioxygenase extradiol